MNRKPISYKLLYDEADALHTYLSRLAERVDFYKERPDCREWRLYRASLRRCTRRQDKWLFWLT